MNKHLEHLQSITRSKQRYSSVPGAEDAKYVGVVIKKRKNGIRQAHEFLQSEQNVKINREN